MNSLEAKKIDMLFNIREAQAVPPIDVPDTEEGIPGIDIGEERGPMPMEVPLETAPESIPENEPAPETGQPPEDVAEELMESFNKPNEREIEVVNAIQHLRKSIVDVADAVFKIRFTEDQVKEVTTKVVALVSESVGDISIERVKDIAKDLVSKDEK